MHNNAKKWADIECHLGAC